MKLAIVVGTRPEIIKMSPIIRYCIKSATSFTLIHSGQHYSYSLDGVFFKELELPQPNYNLQIGSASPCTQTSLIMQRMEPILLEEKPSCVLVQGDTNTVLGGALAAVKSSIKVGHVEAGLRSYDPQMQEELNRRVTDHISNYLFAPTKTAKKNALKEGIAKEKIFLTGNTIVDALKESLQIAEKNSMVLESLGIKNGNYFVVTAHRAENTDNKMRLDGILRGLGLIYDTFKLPIIYPIHQRTKKKIEDFGLKMPNGVKVIEPLSYIDFLKLQNNAKVILTDSGGVQEESCIIKVPCVTLRDNTERPETIANGSNVLAGTNPSAMVKAVEAMIQKKRDWKNPFGNGKSGKKIVEILKGVN